MATLIAAGIVFGMAAAFAREDVSPANVTATVVAGLLPLALAVRFWGIFAFGWSLAPFRNEFGLFLMSLQVVVPSCVVLGFNLANLVSHRVARSTGLWLVEVHD